MRWERNGRSCVYLMIRVPTRLPSFDMLVNKPSWNYHIFPLEKWASNGHLSFSGTWRHKGNMTYLWWQGNYFWARHSGLRVIWSKPKATLHWLLKCAPFIFTKAKIIHISSTQFLFTTSLPNTSKQSYPKKRNSPSVGLFAWRLCCNLVRWWSFTCRYKNHPPFTSHLQ